MELKRLLDPPGKLPTIPKILHQLIASFSDEDVSLSTISRQIAADPALTAKLLRLANSAYFHVSRTVGTVDDALRMLGFVMVRNLVLGNGMVAAFSSTQGMDLARFWRYNLYTACAARWLASSTGANADLAFTVGLMHGIGQLQMHAAIPDEIAAIDHEVDVIAAERAERELRAFGFHHGDVAAELATLWNFPRPIAQALRDASQPMRSADFSPPAACVHLGAWRARSELLSLGDDALIDSYPADVAKRLGLAPTWLPALAGRRSDAANEPMPPLTELSEGLDAMLA